VLVQRGDEARLPGPQDVVTDEVHGSVEVADGQAQPRHAVRQVDGPLGRLQRLHRVPQTQHCGTQTGTSAPTAFHRWREENSTRHSHFRVRLMCASSWVTVLRSSAVAPPLCSV